MATRSYPTVPAFNRWLDDGDDLRQFHLWDSWFRTEIVRQVKLYRNGQISIRLNAEAWSEPQGYWHEHENTTLELKWYDDYHKQLFDFTFELLSNTSSYASVKPGQRFFIFPWVFGYVPEISPIRNCNYYTWRFGNGGDSSLIDLCTFEDSLDTFDARLHDDNSVLQFRMFDFYAPARPHIVQIKLYKNHEVATSINSGTWSQPHGYWCRRKPTTYDIKWHEQNPEEEYVHSFSLLADTKAYCTTSPDGTLHFIRYLLIPWVQSIDADPTS